jgi:hypothetical protein
MKKLVSILLVFLILLTVGAFAETVSENKVTKDVEKYVKSFVEKGGINEGEIREIKEIDQSDLPENVKIQKIDKNKVGIYGVNYSQQNKSKELFVVTYSTEKLEEKEIEIVNIQNLNFGLAGITNGSKYLESANGVSTGRETGYVMMREGSVTGISTSLEINGEGSVEIKIYKNGKDTGFSNFVDGGNKDYDLQSEDIVKYYPGDIISVYVESEGNVNWGNVITLVETKS